MKALCTFNVKYLFVLILLSFASTLQAQTTEQLLANLDDVIEHKEDYRSVIIKAIDSLRIVASYATNGELACVYHQLYQQFSRYQADSALVYIEKLSAMPIVRNNHEYYTTVCLEKAITLGIMGEYSEAASILETLNVDSASVNLRNAFYHTCRTVYGWKADYMRHASATSSLCQQKTQLYRDSIIMTDPDVVSREIVRADSYLCCGKPDSAIALLSSYRSKAEGPLESYLYFIMSEAYRMQGDVELQIHYLARSAICDIKRGITEYSALPTLAVLLKDGSDRNRPYNYLFCSMEDASMCNARLRTIEANEMFPIIDRDYRGYQKQQQMLYIIIAIFLFVVAIMLVVGILFMRVEMRKLSQTRSQLAETNAELTKVNEGLKESNMVKEEYITLYLGRCRSNIDTFEKFRRSLLKLAKANQMSELVQQLRLAEPVKEEHKQFYDEFDKAFLDIHPNFVNDFNSLLQPEARIQPKKGELLAPELRIFALVRLGIKDTAKIAHFLDYSLPTIYNYRSRIHSLSVYPKEEFDKLVMQLP